MCVCVNDCLQMIPLCHCHAGLMLFSPISCSSTNGHEFLYERGAGDTAAFGCLKCLRSYRSLYACLRQRHRCVPVFAGGSRPQVFAGQGLHLEASRSIGVLCVDDMQRHQSLMAAETPAVLASKVAYSCSSCGSISIRTRKCSPCDTRRHVLRTDVQGCGLYTRLSCSVWVVPRYYEEGALTAPSPVSSSASTAAAATRRVQVACSPTLPLALPAPPTFTPVAFTFVDDPREANHVAEIATAKISRGGKLVREILKGVRVPTTSSKRAYERCLLETFPEIFGFYGSVCMLSLHVLAHFTCSHAHYHSVNNLLPALCTTA